MTTEEKEEEANSNGSGGDQQKGGNSVSPSTGGNGDGAPPPLPQRHPAPEQQLSDRQIKARARRTVGGNNAPVSTPGAVSVKPGAVAVDPTETTTPPVPSTEPSLGTATIAPSPTVSQREQEDFMAKSRARPSSSRSVDTTPGAQAVGPSPPRPMEEPTKPSSPSQERDRWAKNRARGMGGMTTMTTTTTMPGAVALTPGAVAVAVIPSEDEDKKTGSVTTTGATTTAPPTPLSRREQDILAKNRGRQVGGGGGSGRSLTTSSSAEGAGLPTTPIKNTQELKDSNLKASLRGSGAVRPGAVSVQPNEPSTTPPPVLEESVPVEPSQSTAASVIATPATAAVPTQSQRDASLKASLRSTAGGTRPGAVAVQPSKPSPSDDAAPMAATNGQSNAGLSLAEQDAQAKARARSGMVTPAAMAGPTAAVVVEEPAAVDASSYPPPRQPSAASGGGDTGLDELARRREQRAAARASRREQGGGGGGRDGSARSMDSSSRSIDSSSRSIDGSTDQPELVSGGATAAASAVQTTISGTAGSSVTNTGSTTTTPVFANMSEDERQRRYDAKMAAMNRGHADSREKRSTSGSSTSNQGAMVATSTTPVDGSNNTLPGGRSITSSTEHSSNTTDALRERRYKAKLAQGQNASRGVDVPVLDDPVAPPATAIRSTSTASAKEAQNDPGYDAKVADIGQDQSDHLDKSDNNNNLEALGAAATAAGIIGYSTTTPGAVGSTPSTAMYSDGEPHDDYGYGSKDLRLDDPASSQFESEQPLMRPAVTVADRGIAVAPDVEYGEYRRPEVSDNDLVVAVAIEEDEDEEKEFLVAAHAVEYDPDSKPPIFKNRRFRLYTIMGCCLFLIVVIVLIVVTTGGGDNNSITTLFLTNPPTETPTAAPTNARESMYLSYLAEKVSPQVAVPGTAHYLAAEWIMNEDPLQLDVSSSRVLQRYLLAFLYYQTTELGTKTWKSCGPPGPGDDDTCTFLQFGRQPDDSIFYTEVPGQIRWMSSVDECRWKGVICGNGDTVIGIEIVGQELTGTLPTELGALPFLQKLSLHYNQFTGGIPAEYAGFRHLLALELHGNLLTGEIPVAFFEEGISSLITFNVGDNVLSGTLDTRVGQLTDLKGLFVYGNNFVGPLPSEIGSLPYLTYSRINGNEFSGPLPPELSRPPQFIEFWFDDNLFSGTIPSEFGRMRRMQDFRLSGNQLNGTIPPELFSMTKAQAILLDSNQLTGRLPSTELLQLTDLIQLRVSRNALTGTIPTEIRNMTSIRLVHLHLNLFNGSVPDVICEADVPNGLNFLQADCAPLDNPPNPCRCCSACCDRSTGVCLSTETST